MREPADGDDVTLRTSGLTEVVPLIAGVACDVAVQTSQEAATCRPAGQTASRCLG